MKINQQQSINFNGRIGNFKTPKFAHMLDSIREDASLVMNREYSDVLYLTKGANTKRINFFKELVDVYNARNFYLKEDEVNIVDRIYKSIKSPKKEHFSIMKNLGFLLPLSKINEVLGNVGNDKKALKFVDKLAVMDVLTTNKDGNNDLIFEFLNSKNKDFYVNNFEKIKSYLLLNKDNNQVVKSLDKLIEENKFDPKYYDNKLNVKNLVNKIAVSESDIFNTDVLMKNYTKPRGHFLEALQQSFYHTPVNLKSENANVIKNLYDSTDKNNVQLRVQVMKYFKNPNSNYMKFANDSKFYVELQKLFNSLDGGDKYLNSFVNKATRKHNRDFESPEGINNLLNEISPKKLDIFYKNYKRVKYFVPEYLQKEVLKRDIETPFIGINRFKKRRDDEIKHGIEKCPGFLSRAFASVENVFNKLRYNITSESLFTQKAVTVKPQNVVETLEKSNNVAETIIENNLATPVVEEKVVKTSEEVFDKVKKEAVRTEKLVDLTKTLDKKLKKEMLANDILGVAKQKLGVKTFENQREAFIENATKMRYEMLPEIFASIMDTRKADRAVGKHRINSSNKDALKLYTMVNGNNKKFVNYLLKKRNVDGSRMFEVKEIIATLENAEKQIQKQKQNNPEYRARDVRKYYNHLLEAKIQQYGKVTRNKASKTK